MHSLVATSALPLTIYASETPTTSQHQASSLVSSSVCNLDVSGARSLPWPNQIDPFLCAHRHCWDSTLHDDGCTSTKTRFSLVQRLSVTQTLWTLQRTTLVTGTKSLHAEGSGMMTHAPASPSLVYWQVPILLSLTRGLLSQQAFWSMLTDMGADEHASKPSFHLRLNAAPATSSGYAKRRDFRPPGPSTRLIFSPVRTCLRLSSPECVRKWVRV